MNACASTQFTDTCSYDRYSASLDISQLFRECGRVRLALPSCVRRTLEVFLTMVRLQGAGGPDSGGAACRAGSVCRATAPAGAGAACFFFQAEDGIRDVAVTGVQTCALPI